MSVITVNYDSISAFVADMTCGRAVPAGVREAHNDNDRSFYWTRDYREAIDLQRRGWQEGADRVMKYADAMSGFVSAAKVAKSVQTTWDFSGVWYDAGKDLSGDPECWACEQFTGDAIAGRVVSIRLNTAVSAAVTAETMAARGTAVLVAVDLLEACGTRVEVIVSMASRQSGLPNVEANIIAKQASESAEPNSLAFNVAHPSFRRRFGFKFDQLNGQSPCMSYPCPMSDAGRREGVIDIDEILSGVKLNAAAMKGQILKIAEKCGLTFTADQIRELIAV